jgi:GNAT superfamily N-acetyltransferase
MIVRGLGLTTELGLFATRSLVVDRDDYLVVTTPDDPTYYYGNLLVLPAPPQVGEVAFWMRRFSDELGANPEIRHVTLCWDGTTGEVGAASELAAAGFVVEHAQVMAAATVLASSGTPTGIDIRALAAEELPRAAELAYEIGDRHDEIHRRFLQRRAAWQHHLVARGIARFWGAFDAGALVGSLGIVSLGARARYQDVQTAEAFRRRGIASALISAAATHAREHGAGTLVIIAMPGSAAARVYERAGFQTIERTASACRYPTE